jgi:uncharacterized membrane protein
MTDATVPPVANPEITQDDKLWGALCYFPLIAIIMFLMPDKIKRPFIKFHAIQSLAFSVVLVVASIILGVIPIIQCFTPLIWLVMLWPALDAYRGNYTQLPVVTDFIKKQGWV